MRYSDYVKQVARLDKAIAECRVREHTAENGSGPWFVRLFPSLRSTTIAVAGRKRAALAKERHRLQRAVFADPAFVWNGVAVNAFRRTVPSSEAAIKLLRSAADAAIAAED